MNALTTYLQNVRNEMSHVVWPTPRKAVMDVVAVVVISALVAVIIAGLDFVFTGLVSYIVNNGI